MFTFSCSKGLHVFSRLSTLQCSLGNYKSYSTLLSMLVACLELPNYNNPCARFHHCYRSLFVTQFRQASTIGGRAESVSCLCVCCWLNDGASPILFQRQINYVTSMTTVGWNFLQGHINNLCDFNDMTSVMTELFLGT